ncbi:enhanced level of genomic instability 1 [Amyelois transitella]|uniref:enhanced level of genomic instability 1 n=1 Tax=Amyelois transitella TaxID=680683 RepID=UPI00298FDCCD|nr:enhanced level of genomic instability 1 [Amyelois transitella]XP_013190836.2 enhanced level of genomic instability 1 [Amyelois transitella]XP_060802534.1 enhanced level of genomic instability 1 [Amyelois transitella]
MSFLLTSENKTDSVSTLSLNDLSKKKYHRCILKPKENTRKYKCMRTLKNKLKKYKLRHDGIEDQDVIDVSQTLIKSLYIKSPKKQSSNQNNNCIFGENYHPKNYLFKMGRWKCIDKTIQNSDLNSPLTNQSINKIRDTLPISEGKGKQQTNAFKLLMDSRNKSIGSNSPGKEKSIDENESQENKEKKSIKAKRNLALQKMAEGKGSLKNKEKEEYQEYCIKKKMEKRAERLKNMITSNIRNLKTEKDTNKDLVRSASTEELSSELDEHISKQKNLTLVSLFDDPEIQNSVSPIKNMISKEDSEFLKKLSPSLKKKENMLSYFKKIERDVSISNDVENENRINDVIIKVKVSSKLKKKVKKRKCHIPKIMDEENAKSENVLIDCIELNSDDARKDRRKRKRSDNTCGNILSNCNSKDVESSSTECRPKRNIKKPVKYTDDVEVFSSDDELHIFTPKKKKHGDKKIHLNKNSSRVQNMRKSQTSPKLPDNADKHSHISKSKMEENKKSDKVLKKNVKLAPIFAAKPQLNPEAIEAKQKFLHSGVPEKLKKIIAEQKTRFVEQCIFPITVHIQQNTNNKLVLSSTPNNLNKDMSDDELCISLEGNLFKNLTDSLIHKKEIENIPTVKCEKYTMLQHIKKIYPKFPVFRTYRMLQEKKSGQIKDCSYQDVDNSIEVIYGMNDLVNENPDKMNWVDKYKATSSKQIIGNFENIKEIRKWLVTWTENEEKSRNKINFESDSSDFYHSDTDSKDSFKPTNNLLIIVGPVGSGKTSSIYAVAAELGIKVIEVNASSKRTGKIMLQDLQEATQSHKVNRGKGSADNSQKSQEILENSPKPLNKRGRPKKSSEKSSCKSNVSKKNENLGKPSSSQDNCRTEMSLILIDDADIVFEQDDGFCSAIVQLVQSSKRPVILISSSASCTHLQRFLQSAKVISMHSLQPRMLGTWLDIMCLADSGVCVPGTGATILDFFKGDIRKAINSLQFYVSSQKQTENEQENNTQNLDTFVDDENSSMSWVEHDNVENRLHIANSLELINQLRQCIIGQQLTLFQCNHQLDLFNVWWSIPKLLINPSSFGQVSKHNKDEHSGQTVVGIEAIANAFDSVSMAEYFRPTKSAMADDITSQPWFSGECDSVSETEHLYEYDRSEELIEEISHNLVSGSILEAQNIMNITYNTDVQFPSMDEYRERHRIVSSHNSLSGCLNPSAVLDRKALALDYWSFCRTICRLEKSKTDNNSKRNNRFCHYLKSLNVTCKVGNFDKLADSLVFKGNENEKI